MNKVMINLDVTALVKRVKNQELLFYPVMIHTLLRGAYDTKLIKDKGLTLIWQIDCGSRGCCEIFGNWEDDFASFYRQYVRACFRKQTENIPQNLPTFPEKAVAIFYTPISDFSRLNLKYPHFYIQKFQKLENKTILPVIFYHQEADFDVDKLRTQWQRICDESL